jgi:hypothetical protein
MVENNVDIITFSLSFETLGSDVCAYKGEIAKKVKKRMTPIGHLIR